MVMPEVVRELHATCLFSPNGRPIEELLEIEVQMRKTVATIRRSRENYAIRARYQLLFLILVSIVPDSAVPTCGDPFPVPFFHPPPHRHPKGQDRLPSHGARKGPCLPDVRLGHKRTSCRAIVMSALHQIATVKAKFRKRSCPLYLQKQTLIENLGMFAKCK